MRNSPQYPRNGTTNRCAACAGKFGLVRHYSWRVSLCSKKCVDRFRSREETDRRWLFRMQAARQTIAIGITGFRSEEIAQ